MAHKQALSLSPQTLRSVPFIELRQSPASDRVAYFIAHDLRHHLSTVYANAELMCNKHYVQSEREEMLEDIKGAVACMPSITAFQSIDCRLTDPIDLSIDSKLTAIGFTLLRTPAQSDQRIVA